MGKVLNFDKFISEKKKETLKVTVFGKEYDVPMEIPAIVPVMMARAESSLDTQQSATMIMRAADTMFGAENVTEMCCKGLSSTDLASLVQMIFKEVNEGATDDDDEVEEISDEDSRVQTGKGKGTKK